MPGLFENSMSGSCPNLEDLRIVNESSCRSWRSRQRLWSGVEYCPRAPAEFADLPIEYTDHQLRGF